MLGPLYRLYKLVLYDAPCIFLWLWKLTQPFLVGWMQYDIAT